MALITKEHLAALDHEYRLIKLLHHRNKNQHRASIWWKDLNILKRSLSKLIPLLSQTNLTRYQTKQAMDIAVHIKCDVVRKCFRSFNVILALAQFVNLGLTLIGLLAKVDFEIGHIEGLDDRLMERKEKGLKGTANSVPERGEIYQEIADEIGEEIGEVVERTVVNKSKASDNKSKGSSNKRKAESFGKRAEKTKKLKKSNLESTEQNERGSVASGSRDNNVSSQIKEKKKKKKKSAMDDIFGF